MRRLSIRAAAIVLVAAGAALFGKGAWIFAKAELAQALLERAWARTLAGETRVKPWPSADTWPIARLSIPDLGQEWIVLEGATGRTLAFGPGHWSGTALPGEPGRSIVSGHRDTHFAAIERLSRGDRLLVETRTGHRRVYRVVALQVVDRRDLYALETALEGDSSLVLVTCYPFRAVRPGGPLRYVVTASERARRD